MNNAKKGHWVEIENTVLTPSERAPQLPEDTKATPLKMWIKGFLVEDSSNLGDFVSVKTLTGRIAQGTLVSINPRHEHDFGEPVLELLQVGMELRSEVEKL